MDHLLASGGVYRDRLHEHGDSVAVGEAVVAASGDAAGDGNGALVAFNRRVCVRLDDLRPEALWGPEVRLRIGALLWFSSC